jgi:hypothetical protein
MLIVDIATGQVVDGFADGKDADTKTVLAQFVRDGGLMDFRWESRSRACSMARNPQPKMRSDVRFGMI